MVVDNSFSFGGMDSLSKGLRIESKRTLNAPEPDLEEYEVPGRDGTVFCSNRRRRNVTVEYDTFLQAPEPDDLPRFTGDIKRWLLSKPGEYLRLEDTYDPDHFRLAVYSGSLDFEEASRRFTRQTVSFSCLPYRYRKTGDIELPIETEMVLVNDTGFDALPLLRINLVMGNLPPQVSIRIEYESGGAYAETLGDLAENQDIASLDSEKQLIFDRNNEVMTYNTLPSFPTLRPGENHITITGERLRKVWITPRWREL